MVAVQVRLQQSRCAAVAANAIPADLRSSANVRSCCRQCSSTVPLAVMLRRHCPIIAATRRNPSGQARRSTQGTLRCQLGADFSAVSWLMLWSHAIVPLALQALRACWWDFRNVVGDGVHLSASARRLNPPWSMLFSSLLCSKRPY